MAALWARSFSHRLSMLAVAAQGVTEVKEHPTHTILADFAARLDTLAVTLQEMQGELEVSYNTFGIILKLKSVFTLPSQDAMSTCTFHGIKSLVKFRWKIKKCALSVTKINQAHEMHSWNLVCRMFQQIACHM